MVRSKGLYASFLVPLCHEGGRRGRGAYCVIDAAIVAATPINVQVSYIQRAGYMRGDNIPPNQKG